MAPGVTLSQWALLGFATWTLLLLIGTIGLPRISAVIRRQARPNSFTPALPHGSERYQRIMRAHMNCVENQPVFAALVLLGAELQVQSSWFQTAALLVLPARVAQSVVHVASGSNRAVLVRFSFFNVQLVCFALMVILLIEHALAR